MKDSAIDKRARLYRAVSGLIPGGSFIVEYMIDRLPEQRMERLFKFVAEMNNRIETLENRQALETEEFGHLAENAVIASSRAQSSKRLAWLASIAVPAKSDPPEMEWEHRQRAVGILNDLRDADIECLLNHVSFEKTVKFERDNSSHCFVSAADRTRLSDHELFLRNLLNERLDVYRSALVRHGLLRAEGDDVSRARLTQEGRLFVYLISGVFPRD